MRSVTVRLLHAIARPPEAAGKSGATENYTIENALDFANKTVPGFLDYIKDKDVLDHGCGPGWQACAMAIRGARSVHGTDIRDIWIESGRRIAQEYGVADRVSFSLSIPRAFDVCVSLGAFEHYREPEAELQRLIATVKPGGTIVIAWAEPWFSPHGSHFSGFFRLPWLNLLFSERTLLQARAKYKSDGATRFHEIAGGLNKMTVARFDRAMANSGCEIVQQHSFAVKHLPLVTKIPGIRELMTAACSCVLRTPSATVVSTRDLSPSS